MYYSLSRTGIRLPMNIIKLIILNNKLKNRQFNLLIIQLTTTISNYLCRITFIIIKIITIQNWLYLFTRACIVTLVVVFKPFHLHKSHVIITSNTQQLIFNKGFFASYLTKFSLSQFKRPITLVPLNNERFILQILSSSLFD